MPVCNKKKRFRWRLPRFHSVAAAFAVAFAAAVALLFIVDIAYLAEFSWHAPPERSAALYAEILSPGTRQEILLTLYTSTFTTALALLIAIPAGYGLSRCRIPFKVVVDTLVDAAVVLPPLILGVSLLVLFSLLRRLAAGLGEPGHPNPLVQGVYEFFIYQKPGIVLTQFFVATALCVRALRAAFDVADRRVEDVALTLGCTPFGAFRRAALPQALPGLLAGGVLAWSYSMGIYAPVAIFAGTIRGRTSVLATRTFLEVSVGRLELALVLTLFMAALAMTVLVLFKVVVSLRTAEKA